MSYRTLPPSSPALAHASPDDDADLASPLASPLAPFHQLPSDAVGSRSRSNSLANANPLTSRSRAGSNAVRPNPALAQFNAPSSPPGRNHRRRSSMNEMAIYSMYSEGEALPVDEPQSPTDGGLNNPFSSPRNSLYGGQSGIQTPKGAQPPPSAFAYPYQSSAPAPGANPNANSAMLAALTRRASIDSMQASVTGHGGPGSSVGHGNYLSPHPLSPQSGTVYAHPGAGSNGYGPVGDVDEYGRPYAPYMERSGTPTSQVYNGSAAAAMSQRYHHPRSGSIASTMRPAFLSPASRPGSSLWAPPSYPYANVSANGSSSALYGSGSGYNSYQDLQAQLRRNKPLMPSTRLPQKLGKEEKPWLTQKDGRTRASYWLTLFCLFLGLAGGAVLIYFDYTYTLVIGTTCSVLSEDWSSGSIDTSTWAFDNELGGFEYGEFQMTTSNSSNVFIKNSELYILPTLTSSSIGTDAIFDGYTFTVSDCSTTNTTACTVTSSNSTGDTIPPVISGRISTKNSTSIKYGVVEVEAKNPTGDWLWPAIWMLPTDNVYGAWPLSGEIDIMEARGNPLSYPAQGVDYVRSTLYYGVFETLTASVYGWYQNKRSPYNEDFHTYAMEWTDSWMRFYVDTRLDAMIDISLSGHSGKSFWDRADFPSTAYNESTEVVVEDIWESGGANAPFDEEFYLILSLNVGGVSGWFPDSEGDKPWYDDSDTALREFAEAQDTWYATWATDEDDLAFRIKSVKISSLC